MRKSVSGLHLYLLSLSFLFLILCCVPAFAQGAGGSQDEMLITADLLLPKNTCTYTSIRDINVLRDTWSQTALGKMQARKDMQEFSELFRTQIIENFSTLESRFGVTMKEIIQIASTEVAGALIKINDKQSASALIVNVGDKIFETQTTLGKIAERTVKNGGAHQKQEAVNAEVHILTIKDAETGMFHKAYYVLTGEILLSTDKPEIVKDILGRIIRLRKNISGDLNAFAEIPAYLEILNKTIVDDHLPDIIWYVDPIPTIQVRQMMLLEQNPSQEQKRNTAKILTEAGFDGVKAVGGVMTVRHQDYDVTHRVFVSLEKPVQKSLNMLSFDKTENKDLPDWITEKMGSVHVVNLDVTKAFDNLGPLVNGMFGEGSDSVWDDVLDGLKNDEYGPQLDLRDEIVTLLENKLIYSIQNVKPGMEDSERTVIAIPVKNEAKFRENLTALLGEESNFEQGGTGNEVYWTMIREKKEGKDPNELTLMERRFPKPTLTVWDGYLLITSVPEYITELKAGKAAGNLPMTQNTLYQFMQKEVKQHAKGAGTIMFYFENNAISHHHSYEMLKSGKWSTSPLMHSPMLNSMFKKNRNFEANLKKMDASELPEFQLVRKYFLPSAGYAYEVEDGIIYQGFLMSEEKMGISLDAKKKVMKKK